MSKVDKIISFDISSDFGMFKKPDVNNVYFTFNIILKPTLLGILGAIIGLGGYSEQYNSKYPEFYESLHDLLIGVVPATKKGVFDKRLIKYNNTVGYANKDGGTLNIIEQTLIEPKYKIYIGLDSLNENHQKLIKYIDEKQVQYEYIPYMGKNEFKLDIANVKHYDNIKTFIPADEFAIFSLFPNISDKAIKTDEALRDPFDSSMYESYFYYFERLPIALDELNQYQYENFVYTNAKMGKNSEFINSLNLFSIDEKVVCLY